ncbi:MAG: oligogalacturonate lyase [Saprospiraceae bacterium]|nr:MAG: oligogalacturonate lyase [Saprospiraceae bacterium]
MNKLKISLSALIIFLIFNSLPGQVPILETGSQTPMPKEWIDKDTGHKLKRISEGNTSNRSFYFHNNPFLKAKDGIGDLMIYYGSTEDDNRQLFSLNLETMESVQLTHHPDRKSGEIVGKNRREVFYQIQDSVFATHIDKQSTRLVYVFTDDFKAHITTLNADETKLAGTWAGPEKRAILEKYPAKGDFFNRIFEAKIPHTLFTVDIETGELQKIHTENTWLGHIQFSTTDPDILMFCHEGPWHEVDRIWNIDIQTKAIKKVHERSVHREIAGHEFWSWDGKTIWYDLQIPRGETFYLAGYKIKNGKKTRYQMDRNEWSIHFNISPDQKLFCGDGGNPTQVAKAEDGMWIYLFKPKKNRLKSTKLVNMKHHEYRLEPNVHFSPDGKWIIFRANFEGESQIYAVEIQKSK